MAAVKKLTLKKMPKKPKQSASIKTKENYLKKVAEVKKENNKRKTAYNSAKKKNETLNKKIAGVSK